MVADGDAVVSTDVVDWTPIGLPVLLLFEVLRACVLVVVDDPFRWASTMGNMVCDAVCVCVCCGVSLRVRNDETSPLRGRIYTGRSRANRKNHLTHGRSQ